MPGVVPGTGHPQWAQDLTADVRDLTADVRALEASIGKGNATAVPNY